MALLPAAPPRQVVCARAQDRPPLADRRRPVPGHAMCGPPTYTGQAVWRHLSKWYTSVRGDRPPKPTMRCAHRAAILAHMPLASGGCPPTELLHTSLMDAQRFARADFIRSSRARVDQVVDEEHPPLSTGRTDTILTGGCGGAEAQVPSEARNPLCPPLLPHALRGGRSSSQ